MLGGDSETARRVDDLIRTWTPSEEFGHESKFQSELQNFLDEELNKQGGLGLDSGGNYVVSTERGVSRGDVVVDDTVGIELKRNFSNSQKKKLRGQLEDYGDNYPFVFAVACGVDDMDGWRELENKFQNRGTGLGMNQTEFTFIVKRRSEFGESDTHSGSGGLFDGDGLL